MEMHVEIQGIAETLHEGDGAALRVAAEWLPNETCAELVAAEVLSAIGCELDDAEPAPLAQRRRTAVAAFDHVPELAPPPAAPAAPSIFVEALLTGLEEVDARELDQRLCRAAALERGRLARIGPLLLAFANLRGSCSSASAASMPTHASGSECRRARRARSLRSSAPAHSRQ